jgi:hypothetical protein
MPLDAPVIKADLPLSCRSIAFAPFCGQLNVWHRQEEYAGERPRDKVDACGAR